MKIFLASNDESLIASCRVILAEVFGSELELAIGRSGDAAEDGGQAHQENFAQSDAEGSRQGYAGAVGQSRPEATGQPHGEGLFISDLAPGQTDFPAAFDRTDSRQHLFLLHSKNPSGQERLVAGGGIGVLLEPFEPDALRVFFREAREKAPEEIDFSAKAATLRGERDEMLQFLIQADLKLQEYDNDRSNFLARSLHDFRAPLTAICGYCGLLLAEDLGALTAEQREVLERMQQSAKRLSRLTDAMFRLSIHRQAAQELKVERADMRDCVDRALHEVALFVDDKGISVAVAIEESADGLLFDKSQIEQTLVNLLDNACKFTPRNGRIEIKGYPFFWERRINHAGALDPSADRRMNCVHAPNSFRVDIRDTGPGVPHIHAAKIFEEHTSYSGGQDRSGGGLGLAICRMILQQHRGQVWAESHAAGAVFSFVLPVPAFSSHAPTGASGTAPAYAAGAGEDRA